MGYWDEIRFTEEQLFPKGQKRCPACKGKGFVESLGGESGWELEMECPVCKGDGCVKK